MLSRSQSRARASQALICLCQCLTLAVPPVAKGPCVAKVKLTHPLLTCKQLCAQSPVALAAPLTLGLVLLVLTQSGPEILHYCCLNIPRNIQAWVFSYDTWHKAACGNKGNLENEAELVIFKWK